MLGIHADPERPWISHLPRSFTTVENAGAGFDAPHIERHLAIGSKESGALLHAAKALAGKLRAMVESGTTRVFEEGQQQPLTYSHIAVLCRACKLLLLLRGRIEATGVPYLTVAGGGLPVGLKSRLTECAAGACRSNGRPGPRGPAALAGLRVCPIGAVSPGRIRKEIGARNPLAGA